MKVSGIKVLEVAKSSGSGHIGGSLSLIQAISYFLYKLSNRSDNWKIILSKGHASLGLYSIFETLNLEINLTKNYCTIPNGYHGHTCSKASKFILASTGSLGHGLPISAGYAYAQKRKKSKIKTICITGDGDLQEGSNLEIMHSLLKLKNCELKIINDNNSSVESQFIDIDKFFNNLRNNYEEAKFIDNFDMSYFSEQKRLENWLSLPGLRIANCKTSKGFGFQKMYNNPRWHAGIPNEEEYLELLSNANFNLKNEE